MAEADGEDDDLVVTPGGLRGRESVRFVGADEAVRQNLDGTSSIVPRATTNAEEAGGGMTDELVLTPGGYRPRSQVHLIPPQHSIRLVEGRHQLVGVDGREVLDLGAVAARPEGLPVMPRNVFRAKWITPALGSGWIVYTDWTNVRGSPISSFTTTWTVPPAPSTASGQTVFLFNGIQNSTMIYQPVLQWGPSGAGGGAYWAVASWYADGQGGLANHSTLVRVNPGDVLIGVMTQTGHSSQGFSYDCRFQGIANTDLAIQNVPELTWAIETLEAYSITRATDYPATDATRFTAIEIRTGAAPGADPTLAWTPVDSVTDTGQHAVTVSNANPGGEVDLYYNNYREWLQSLYADLLGRAPDPGGLASWLAHLTSGANLASVADGFLRSAEYCERIITGLYQQVLSRTPDAGGLASWTGTMEQGTALQEIILGFCDSVEYRTANPVPDQFVESLYVRLLHRPSDPGGKQSWVAALQAGESTTHVINGFLTSTEYCTNQITDLYQRLLGRQPDASGLADWVNQMTGGTAFQQIRQGFVTSPEYQERALRRFP